LKQWQKLLSPILHGKWSQKKIFKDRFSIIEVGSFKGLSTSFIGEACSNITEVYGKTCQIICVDTWLGSPEFYEFFGIDEPRNEYAHE
jgi:hypothetical protein